MVQISNDEEDLYPNNVSPWIERMGKIGIIKGIDEEEGDLELTIDFINQDFRNIFYPREIEKVWKSELEYYVDQILDD